VQGGRRLDGKRLAVRGEGHVEFASFDRSVTLSFELGDHWIGSIRGGHGGGPQRKK